MWPYFGSKAAIIKYYPPPKYPKIIEPFAGSAKYSLKYWDRDILLVDKYDVITRIWQWLQKSDPEEIRNLRQLKLGENVNDFEWSCEEAKWLMGFMLGSTVARPRKTAQKWKTTDRKNYQKNQLIKIAKGLYKIKLWDIHQGDYRDIPNQEATWFIDPPYMKMGKEYKHGSKDIDYSELAKWCKSRSGQVIVCEQLEAQWLPFRELTTVNGTKGKSTEVIWSNQNLLLQGKLI